MKTMSLGCDGEKILLSKCSIGEIWKCRCCDVYLLNVGRITFCLNPIDLVFLVEMLIEALELSAFSDFDEKEFRYRRENA